MTKTIKTEDIIQAIEFNFITIKNCRNSDNDATAKLCYKDNDAIIRLLQEINAINNFEFRELLDKNIERYYE